jgi:hypothetical protein
MDAFEFQNYRITQSKFYGRIGFSDTNNILSLIPGFGNLQIRASFLIFMRVIRPITKDSSEAIEILLVSQKCKNGL